MIETAMLLRAYVGEYDVHHGKPTHECIVEEALKFGLAGATVLRAKLGYGRKTHAHRAVAVLSTHAAPVVVEIIDQEDKLNAFLPVLERYMDGGLVTFETVRVMKPAV